MRVILIHNPGAGAEDHTAEELCAKLRSAGHAVKSRSLKEGNYRDVLHRPEADVVLAAGGDGTVRKVVLAMAGQPVPLSILPLGSANNLAHVLGLNASVEELIGGLGAMVSRPLDLGRARGPWGEERFIEGFGLGLFPDYLAALEAPEESRLPREKLRRPKGKERDLDVLLDMLAEWPARACALRVDGEDCSGEYFVLEALNSRSIGPMRRLAAGAETGDGWLDLALVEKSHRDALGAYFEKLLADGRAEFPGPARRFRRLELDWRGELLHLDDSLWPERLEDGTGRIEITVEPGALSVLVPGE